MRWERIHGDGQSVTESMPYGDGLLVRTVMQGRPGSVGLTFVAVKKPRKKAAKKAVAKAPDPEPAPLPEFDSEPAVE